MNNNVLEHKKYIAQLYFDLEDAIIVGRVINAREVISFYANTILEAKQAFIDVIDTYLATCTEENILAAKPYSGKFNLRIGSDLHRELSIQAAQQGISLNDFTATLIKRGLSHRSEPKLQSI